MLIEYQRLPVDYARLGSKRAVTWLSGFEVGPTLRHATMGAKCQDRSSGLYGFSLARRASIAGD
jgi:hypothetical protein